MKKATPMRPISNTCTAPASNAGSIKICLQCTVSTAHSGSDAVTNLNSVSALGMMLRNKLQHIERNIRDTATPLTLNADGSIDCLTVLMTSSDCSDIVAPEASIIDKVRNFLERAVYAAECIALGDQSAVQAATHVRATRAEIRPAKSTQLIPAKLGNDGNIYVTNASARAIVKLYLNFLTAVARVNALGMSVEVIIGNERYCFPVLRDGATKTTWLTVGTRQIIAPVTGFFRTSLTVEILIDGKTKILRATERDAGMLIEADRAQAAVEMVVEVFRASNPFLGDEETFRILEVLRVTDTGKQEDLTLAA